MIHRPESDVTKELPLKVWQAVFLRVIPNGVSFGGGAVRFPFKGEVTEVKGLMSGGNTQMDAARRGEITPFMIKVSQKESVPAEVIRDRIAAGTVVIPANPLHGCLDPVGIGLGMSVKVNVNLGRSPTSSCLSEEIDKVQTALKYGADAVMDLSTGPDIDSVRRAVISACHAPVGTVPVYQAAEMVDNFEDLPEDVFVEVVRRQAEQGVDFMTIHAGVLRKHVPLAAKRVIGIVSRGGALMARWMERNGRENPFYTRFDEILDIASQYDITLSLGDGMRPGCLADASDEAQFSELDVLGELTQKAWARGVQVMIEGPGHMPFDQIAENMTRQKKICNGAPFYVLGPLVTDIAPGYDHITGAIGATMAAVSGADFLCYVTPKEHLGLPDNEDVRVGLIAFKIAAHAADIAKGHPGARDRDDAMARARVGFDWKGQFELALDPDRAREYHAMTLPGDEFLHTEYCSMCGEKYCAMRNSAIATGKKQN
jgi:phosphomethylpyrimidine synthase